MVRNLLSWPLQIARPYVPEAVADSPGLTTITKPFWKGSSPSLSFKSHFCRETLPDKAQCPTHPSLGPRVNNIRFFPLCAHIVPGGFLYSFPALTPFVFHPQIISVFISLKPLSSSNQDVSFMPIRTNSVFFFSLIILHSSNLTQDTDWKNSIYK